MNARLVAMISMVLASCGIALATPFMEVESTVLTNGWFQYRVKLLPDPFFWQAGFVGIYVGSSNWVELGATPTDWTDGTNGSWNYATTNLYYWQDRPYQRVFTARSSLPGYRLGTNNAVVLFSLWPQALTDGQWQFTSANMVGYCTLPSLIPCAAEESDGSPPDSLYVVKVIPDVKLTSLLITNNTLYGITYNWVGRCLLELQSSSDLNSWLPVARFNGVAGDNTWISSQPLAAVANSFRLQLITADLWGNIVTRKTATTAQVSNLRCTIAPQTAVVSFLAASDGNYLVEAQTPDRTVVASNSVSVSGGHGVASFATSKLPMPVLFSVKPD